MRRFFLFYLGLFIGILTSGCKRDNPSDDFLYPETIMGHWDIEGGGTLFLKRKTFLYLRVAILFLVRYLLNQVL